MWRLWAIAILGVTALGQRTQVEQLDSALEHLPFEEWLKGGPQAHINWSLRMSPPILGENQRLAATITIDVNGDEIRKRAIPGQLALILQIHDRGGRTYRSRPARIGTRFNPMDAAVHLRERVYVVPGDYLVAAAIYDTESREHSLKQIRVHVPRPPRDGLSEIWRDMPGVGFAAGNTERARLWLPLETSSPLRVDLVAIQSVTGKPDGLLPRLQVLSQIKAANATVHLTVLDLPHRKVTFAADVNGFLDSRRVSAALGWHDPRVIHADLLSKFKEGAQFFVAQIDGLLSTGEPNVDHAVIVLAAPWQFPKEGVATAKPAPGSRVFFIHCDLPGRYESSSASHTQSPPLPDGVPSLPSSIGYMRYDNADSLASTLAPLHPHEFHAITALEFRRALGAILHEIAGTD